MARMISVVSSNPLVVMNPALTPLCVISALVATVLPCLKRVVLPSNCAVPMPAMRAASSTASMTPREKSSGVVEALAVQTSPVLLNTTTSVNVPPVSTPIMYCAFDAMLFLPFVSHTMTNVIHFAFTRIRRWSEQSAPSSKLTRDILQTQIWEGQLDVKAPTYRTLDLFGL